MILGDVLAKTKDHFAKLGYASAKVDSELLLSTALGWKRLDLYLKQDYPMTEQELHNCRELVRRRSKGEPVAYILGYKDFYNIRLNVNPSVLIPRSETEHIVDEAINYFKEHSIESPVVVDLGAGSGCVGLAVAKEVPAAKVLCIEKSNEAFQTLVKNIELNELQTRVLAIHSSVEELNMDQLSREFSNFFDGADFNIDALLSNPPYIEEGDSNVAKDVFEFEPHAALFAEDKGLVCYKTWPEKFQQKLKPSALLAFEMGFEQGPAVKEIFTAKTFLKDISIIKDYSENDRIVRAYNLGE